MSGLASFFKPFFDESGKETDIGYDTSLSSISKEHNHRSLPTDSKLTQFEWRKKYSKILAIFVERRLFFETAEYSKEEKILFSQIFGVSIDAVQKAHDTEGHHATSIAQLSLDNAKFSLSAAPILLVSRRQLCNDQYVESPQLSAAPTIFFQKGPAFPVYKYVVSMQIMEEDVSVRRQLVENSTKIFGTPRLRRVMVFFYDEYAMRLRQIAEFAEKQGQHQKQQEDGKLKSNGIALTFKNIPSKCIFPWKMKDPTGVLQSIDSGVLSDYCICIGGKSNIHQKHNSSNNSTMFVHLESSDMEIRASVFRGSTNVEFSLTQESVKFLDGNGRTSLDSLQVQPSSFINVGPKLKQIATEKEIEERLFTAKSQERRLLGMKRKNSESVEEHDVEYMPLIDIPEFLDSKRGHPRKESHINIRAAVLSFTSPRYTRKRDLMMVVTIFDESLPVPVENSSSDMATGIPTQMTLTIFAKKIEDLPNLKYAGDIIRCHNIRPEMKDGSIYLTAWHWNSIAVARPSDNSITWFETNAGVRMTRGKLNSWDFHELDTEHAPTNLDNLNAQKLWAFARNRMSESPNIRMEYKTTISDLMAITDAEVVYKDLTVMVCSVTEYPTENQDMYSPRGVIRIWDGTGPPRTDAFLTENGASMSIEPNLLCLESIVEICRNINAKKEGFSTSFAKEEFKSVRQFDPKSLCGMVVNLEIWENSQWQLVKKASPGTFVRLRQIGVSTWKKNPQLKVLRTFPSTCIMFVPKSTYEVKRMVLSHQLRIQSNHPYNQMSACLKLELPARIMNKGMLSRTLNSIGSQSLITCLLGPVPFIFHVRFYVVGLELMPDDGSHDELSPRLLLSVHDGINDMEVIVPKHLFHDLLKRPTDTLPSENNDILVHQNLNNMIGKQYDGFITSLLHSHKRFFVLSEQPSLVIDEAETPI